MNTKIKTNMTALLDRLIKSDTALRGFSADDLPLAAKLRAINTTTSREQDFTHEELSAIAAWAEASGGFESVLARFPEGECCYYVCADGSLYFASSADSEVWADANDFAVERILNGYEGKLDAMDAGLLNYLGGYAVEAVEERGIRE